MFSALEDFKILLSKLDINSRYIDAFISTKPPVLSGTRPNKETRARRKLQASRNEAYRNVFISHVKNFITVLLKDVETFDEEKFSEECLYDLFLNNGYVFAKPGDEDLKFDISGAFEKAQDKDLHTEFIYYILQLSLKCCKDEDVEALEELLVILDFKPVVASGANALFNSLPQLGNVTKIISEQVAKNETIDGRSLASALNMAPEVSDKFADIFGTIDIKKMQNDPENYNSVIDKLTNAMKSLRL